MSPVDPCAYDQVVVAFSGGKDSLAALLHLLDLGVSPTAIELHHHLVDGRGRVLMDWPITPAYVAALADHFGLRLFHSWRDGGFRQEMADTGRRACGVDSPRCRRTSRCAGAARH